MNEVNIISIILLLPLLLNAAPNDNYFRKKRDVRCSNVLPDFEYFQYGYDVTELSIYHCKSAAAKRAQIYDLNNCETKKKWTNSFARKDYDVPDTLSVTGAVGTTKNEGRVYSDLEQFRSEVTHSVDVGDYYKKTLFLKDEDYRRMSAVFANKSRVVVSSNIGNIYNVRIDEYSAEKAKMGSFTRDVLKLPDVFAGNELAYIEFIKKYGTHYLLNAIWGGMTRRITVFGDEYKDVNDFDLITKAKLNFPQLTQGDVEECRNSQDKFALFKNYEINYTQEFHGGFVDDILEKGVEMWLRTIQLNAALLNTNFRPISSLLQHPHESALEQAINTYFARAYLDETIRVFKEENKNEISKKQSIQNVLKEYENIVNYDVYDKSIIEKLTHKVQFEKRELLLKEIADKHNSGSNSSPKLYLSTISAILISITLCLLISY